MKIALLAAFVLAVVGGGTALLVAPRLAPAAEITPAGKRARVLVDAALARGAWTDDDALALAVFAARAQPR